MTLQENKTRLFLNISIALVGVFIFSCSKSSGTGDSSDDGNHIPVDNNDTSKPVIVIDKPIMNQVYVSGDTIKIQGNITDNGLYRGKIKIINDLNGLALLDQSYEIHGLLFYAYNLAYKTSVTSVSNYTVSVEFEDHGLNTTTQTVKVKVNP